MAPPITKPCIECGATMKKVGIGAGRWKLKKFCSAACGFKHLARRHRPPLPACSVSGCPRTVRSSGATMCERHYFQMRRNGYVGPMQRDERIGHSSGYQLLMAPDHALRTEHSNSPRVYEHRAMMFSEVGDGPICCADCGKEMRWKDGDSCVCRTNGDPSENQIGALEIRCRSCAGKLAYEASKGTLAKVHYRFLERDGKRQTLTEWAREMGMKPSTLARRLDRYHWPLDKALATPVRLTPLPSQLKA